VELQRLFVLTLLLATGLPSFANNELTPQLGLRFGGEVETQALNVETLETRPAFGLTYGRKLRGRGWLWTAWSLQSTEFDAPGLLPDRDTIDLDVHYVHVGTSYRGKGGGRTQGFVMFGLGLTWVDPERGEFDSELGGSIVIGGGFRTPIRPALDLRFDVRGYAAFTETRLQGVCGGVGCSIEFAGGGEFQIELLAGVAFGF
jgi:hypothetical protein